MKSSRHAVPESNMTNALIFQAAIAGLIMILSFAFNGKMKRTEANKREIELAARPLLQDKETSTDSYPTASVIGIRLSDPSSSSSVLLVEEK